MIDIHAHVLWGLDDGPEAPEQSRALLRAAAESGTTDLVATPHASPEYPYNEQLVRERFEQLRSDAGGVINLHLGCDFHLTYDNIEDAIANPRKYSIANGPYLLVEFSDLMIFKTSERDLERLRDAGMIPVITHPERNPLLRQRLPLLRRFVEQGVRMQVTAGSYLGRFGRKAKAFAEDLTAAGLVHVVASDTHHLIHRPPGLAGARDYIANTYGEEMADCLVLTNPRAVLDGNPTTSLPPVKPRRSWIGRWFGG